MSSQNDSSGTLHELTLDNNSGLCCHLTRAGDPSGSGGLQISSAEGVARDAPFSVFFGCFSACDVCPHDMSGIGNIDPVDRESLIQTVVTETDGIELVDTPPLLL